MTDVFRVPEGAKAASGPTPTAQRFWNVHAVKRRDPKQDYVALVKSIKGELVTFKELSDPKFVRPEKCFVIRHDCDKSLRQAVAMAHIEQAAGIRSTYFLLHTAEYFNVSMSFFGGVWEIMGLGHDIGIHNDSITQAIVMRGSPAYRDGAGEVLRRAIDMIRKAKIEILGTACHGAGECYKYNYRNYEVFGEFDAKRNEAGGMKIPPQWKLSMRELGLRYEVYLNPRPDYYLSDSHGKWYGIFISKDGVMPFERTMSQMTTDYIKSREQAKAKKSIAPYLHTNYGRKIVEKFNRGWHPDTKWEPSPRVLQLLAHPLHWKFVK